MTSRPLRVVYCVDSFALGGTELNAVRTAERLERTRYEVDFACLRPEGPLLARVERAGLRVAALPIRNLYSPRTVLQGARFARYARRADIVHAHDIYSNIFAVPWARIAGVRAVIASRRWWTETNRRGLATANRVAYRFAHLVLANSPAVARLVEQTEHVRPSRIATIPNFVDDEAFIAPGEDIIARWRHDLGIPPGALVVGTVANLHPIKEHRILLEAVAALSLRWPHLHVVLVGDGECRTALEEQARAGAISERVHFAGRVPYAARMNFLFDVAALTSREEGFPNAIVEAMAAGRAVLATAVGGVVDAVRHLHNGMLVPPRDAPAVAQALDRLLGDRPLRDRLAEAARQTALSEYHADAVIPRLGALYDSLVGGGRS